jgi:acyl-CoA thioesterase II
LAYLPSLLDLLDLEHIEENLYRCCAVSSDAAYRLYGGQVAAQALLAAGRTVPDGRLPHSLHGYFLRQGSPVRPTTFQVDRDRDGYSFSARRVVAIQDGGVIFNMSASFAVPRTGADQDAAAGIPARSTQATGRVSRASRRRRCSGCGSRLNRGPRGRPPRRRRTWRPPAWL